MKPNKKFKQGDLVAIRRAIGEDHKNTVDSLSYIFYRAYLKKEGKLEQPFLVLELSEKKDFITFLRGDVIEQRPTYWFKLYESRE